jgi:Holliday junction resolvase RusA-like endonuclease
VPNVGRRHPVSGTHWSDAPPDRVLTMSKGPSTNALWIRGQGRARVRSPDYVAWINKAGWEVKMQIVGMPKVVCRFNCLIEVPISKRDTGNWEKATLDLLEHVGVVSNDGNLNQLEVRPVERKDVMVALYLLPDMGGVRPQAPDRYIGKEWRRPKSKGLQWKLPL